MAANAFIGRTDRPQAQDIASVLGRSRDAWDRLLTELTIERIIDTQEWSSFSAKRGWALKLKHKKRTILYMLPYQGSFAVAFALGGKAVEAARQSGLPDKIIKIINESKRYVEGTDVRIDVKGQREIAAIKKLAAIKLEN